MWTMLLQHARTREANFTFCILQGSAPCAREGSHAGELSNTVISATTQGTLAHRHSSFPFFSMSLGIRGWWQISGLFACREDGYAQTCLGPSFLTDPQQKHGWDQTCVAQGAIQTVLKSFSTAPRKCPLEKRGPRVRSSALCWKSSPAAQQHR